MMSGFTGRADGHLSVGKESIPGGVLAQLRDDDRLFGSLSLDS